MKRIEAIALAAEAAQAEGALLVSNIGFPSRELYAAKDRPENFYMLGSMGLASSIGLGLALGLAQSLPARRVIVLDGDGSVLMNLGTLATIAHYAPENYLLVILDNCCYGSTGSQPTCTHLGTDLAALALAAGVQFVRKVDNLDDLPLASLVREWWSRKWKRAMPMSPSSTWLPEKIIERFMRSAQSAEPS